MPSPLVMGEQQFSGRECDLLRPLLVHYPQYTPYEVLHVSFYRGFDRLSESLIEKSRQRLGALRREEGLWNAEFKPIRNVMSRMRLKLREVGLDPVCMLEVGYMLITYKQPKL